MFFPFQEIHFETTALSQTAINTDSSLMHLYEFLHQREPDTRARLIEKILIHQILKTDKQRFLLVLGYTDTLILYTDGNDFFILTDKNRNHLPVRRIFKSIGKQVKHNLLQLIRIHPKIKMFLFRLKQEINPVLFGDSLEVIHHLTDERHDIHTLHLHLHLLVLNLAEVQYLIDETKHPTGVPFYHHQLLPCVGRQFIILQHLLHRSGYQRKRCTQFVGNIRKEAQLNIRDLLLYRYLMLQPIDREQDINSHKDNNQNKEYIHHIRHRGLPKRRKNHYIQRTFVLHPHPVAVGRTDTEHIFPFRKIRISHTPLLVGKRPLLFKTVQNI